MKMSRNSTNNNPSTSSRYPNPRRTSRGSGGGGGGARGGRQTSEGNSSFHNHNAHGNDRARRRPSLSGAARAAGQHGLSLPSLNVVISTPPSAPPPLVSYHRTIQGPAATDASGCSQSCSASPPSQMLNPDRPHHNRKRIDGIPPAVAVVTCPRGNATESLASSLPASPYLVRLARSCQEHAETIHAIASPTASPTKVDQSQNDSTSEAMCDHPPSSSSVDDDGPCRDALESLHRLLPSVEASVLPSEQNYVADIGHLCDFYNNTMAGGFCPLAPQLWADPWHVLPRLTRLVQHVLALEVDAQSHASTMADDDIQSHAATKQIAISLARFLNAIPDSIVWQSLIWDWVHLAKDLSVLAESGLLSHLPPREMSDRAEPPSIDVEILVWGETVAYIQDTYPKHERIAPTVDSNEFVLNITSLPALVALQAVVFQVLEQALTIHRQQRIPPLQMSAGNGLLDVLAVDFEEHDKSYYAAAGVVGSCFPWNDRPREQEGVRTLLAALRQGCLILENDDEVHLPKQWHVAEAALRALVLLQSDWHLRRAPNVATVIEASLIAARASLIFMKQRSPATSPSTLQESMANSLSRLVSTLILVPPLVRGSNTRSGVAREVQAATFLLLSETLSYLTPDQSTNERDELRRVILRTVSTALHSLPSTVVVPLALTQRSITSLFRLLGDRVTSDTAVFIVARLLPRFDDGFHLDELVAAEHEMIVEQDHEAESSSSRTTRDSSVSRLKRTASGATTRLRKRPKLDGALPTLTSLSCLDDELLGFLGAACRSASTLRTSLLRQSGSDMPSSQHALSESVLQDVINVSSALRLVLAATPVASQEGAYSIELSQMIQDYLECMVAVNEAVLQSPEGDMASHVRSIGELSFACGVLVDLFVKSHFNGFLVEFPFEKARSYAGRTRQLGKRLGLAPTLTGCSLDCDLSDLNPVVEIVYGYMLETRDLLSGENVSLRVFDNVDAAVTIDVRKCGCLRLTCSGSLLSKADADTETQSTRISCLANRLDPAFSLASKEMAVLEKCIELMKRGDGAQLDPVGRLLTWQSLVWTLASSKPWELRPKSTMTLDEESTVERKRFLDVLIGTALVDSDTVVREYASRELGKVLSASNWRGLLILLSNDEEWLRLIRHDKECESVPFPERELCDLGIAPHDKNRSLAPLVSRLLQRIENIGIQGIVGLGDEQEGGLVLRSTSRALCSLCNVSIQTMGSRPVAELALGSVLRRAVRFDDTQCFVTNSSCLFEVSRVSTFGEVRLSPHRSHGAKFALVLIHELLGPLASSIGPSNERLDRAAWRSIETRFERLSTSIQAALLDSWRISAFSTTVHSFDRDVDSFVESCLPQVLAQLVVEKNYGTIQLLAGYRLFLLNRKRLENKQRERTMASSCSGDRSLGAQINDSVPRLPRLSGPSLQRHACDLCLVNGTVEVVLQCAFMSGDPEVLPFFINSALQSKLSLKQVVSTKEMSLLKYFVVELGRNPDDINSITSAMRSAAEAIYPEWCKSDKLPTPTTVDVAIQKWVSKHFMYLLVNVAQSKGLKSPEDQVNSIRSLLCMLDFLPPQESTQFFPQIMTTIDVAFGDEPSGPDAWRLYTVRLFSLEVLAKYIKLVATSQWEVVGQNLTSVVVSLVPVLSDNTNTEECAACRRCATNVLLWMTQGDLGQKLAPYFSEIPFLPTSPLLDSVNASLRLLGVNFDQIQIGSSQDTGDRSTCNDSGAASVASQMDLKRRLETVCPLLENERASVRRAALQHIADVLRSNRDLFYALVENESTTSVKRFVTVAYRGENECYGWTMKKLLDTLLSRCVNENEIETRLQVARCFGEIGAISANRFDDSAVDSHQTNGTSRSRLDPPWYSTPRDQYLLVLTNHLVPALTAGTKALDQNKIAFAIQQVLSLLNIATKSDTERRRKAGVQSRKRNSSAQQSGRADSEDSTNEMDSVLVDSLVSAQIFDVVEPFWSSKFREAEHHNHRPREPPFFRSSSSYSDWMSRWCRHMVHHAHETKVNSWTSLFFACRTAIRTDAGVGLAEFMFPILLLDRLCFGNGQDQAAIQREVHDVLTLENDQNKTNGLMPLTDRRKAISTLLHVLDLFQQWSEPESKPKQQPTNRTRTSVETEKSAATEWTQSDAIVSMKDINRKVPFSLRAKAAESVNMHATALRMLETLSRSTVVDAVFGKALGSVVLRGQNRSRAAGSCAETEIGLMKDVLASLNDFETMTALCDDDVWSSPRTRAKDSVRRKEALKDWQGALHDYECAQQLSGSDLGCRLGVLRCLVELGHFESVIQHTGVGLSASTRPPSDVVPLAVEAAWRLGRWDLLSQLTQHDEKESDKPDSLYQIHLGKAMLHMHERRLPSVLVSIEKARSSVMDGLSNVARESYSRAYDHIVRLQTLREMEDVAEWICTRQPDDTSLEELIERKGLCWKRRLDILSSTGATDIINARMVLARLATDASLEGALHLRLGKTSRKNREFSAAETSFALAEVAFSTRAAIIQPCSKSLLRLQFAKLKHASGDCSAALRMLDLENIEGMGTLADADLVQASCRRIVGTLGFEMHGMTEQQLVDIFVRNALQSTRWMIEGGLKGASESIARFRVIHRLAKFFEKGHFQFARYIDSLLQNRIMVLQGRSTQLSSADDERQRSHTISSDRTCMTFVGLSIKHYAEAVLLDVKHVYQALPRLLSLWFEFTSIRYEEMTTRADHAELRSLLLHNQDEINALMASSIKRISAQVLYTAVPQLISRITHGSSDTVSIVQAMLRRVLTKYPAQAMWPLAWVRQSRDEQRQRIGHEIFHDAIDALGKSESMRRLLVASKILIDYLFGLAKKEVSDKVRDSMKIKPLSDEVDLSEFVPPIQAALSISLAFGDSSRSRDVFARNIPRMRAFDPVVGVMNSKAKPKRLRVLAVAADSVSRLRLGSRDNKEFDIGELYFLVKQEERGDLRKDARVQDLNSVVNRIMATTSKTTGLSARRRRLQLKTFTVTCLSEDTGLLEWVPHTMSLRTVVSKSYNPQADAIHGKRHGKRITDFNDPQLRITFEKKCQDAFFVSGNLTKAAALFESECLASYPPLLYWWYVHQFPDSHAWYEARTKFVLSAAMWSAVGHVIGLGDRHSENILLDKSTGECVHVDFDCIFDKGLFLPKPEVVPFRLTQNMIDAFGPTGTDGMYTCNLQTAMSTLREHRETLLSVLEPFVKDPVINWRRYRSQQRQSSDRSNFDEHSVEAKQKMSVIDERLRGIYNLRNPNLSRVRRTDQESNGDNEDETSELSHHPVPLSVEGQVYKMIAEATSNENLVQLYVGWMPWV